MVDINLFLIKREISKGDPINVKEKFQSGGMIFVW